MRTDRARHGATRPWYCWFLTVAAVLIETMLVGCASLVPERTPLTWSLADVAFSNDPTTGDIRWTYTLIIENPGRLPAKLIQAAVTLGWDGVYLSPEIEQTNHVIPGRGLVRLPISSVFRRGDFEAGSRGSPGRPPNAPQSAKGMWVYWQFLGRHEGGGAIILNFVA